MKLTHFVCAIIAAFLTLQSTAQTERNIDTELIRAPHISFTLGGFIPGMELNDRYGAFGTIGGSFGVKKANNKYWGVKAMLITGAECQTPDLLSNLTTENGEIIDNEGEVAQLNVYGRGGMFGLEAGKVFSDILPSSNPNSGLLIKFGAGSIHHKIRFDYTENHITQLEGEYLPGYDRLTWGYYGSFFAGYWVMDEEKRLNFYAGFTGFGAQTFPLRTTNFDTGIPDVDPRTELGFGIEFGWVLHIYEKAPQEFWY